MIGITHAATGAAIGTLALNPFVALPAAFLSHYVMDAFPHFSCHKIEDRKKHPYIYKYSIILDVLLLSIFFLILIMNANWLVIACAFLAFSPDLAWVYRFSIHERFGKRSQAPRNRFNEFHARIQKFESIKGIFVEIPIILFMLVITFK